MRPADFVNRRVYVAGGSLGIGLAIATRVAALGAHVILFARRQEPLDLARDVVAATRRDATQQVETRLLDVADHRQVREVMARAVVEFGVPDVLVNCAGLARPGRFEEITYEQFDETLRVNLYGCWNTIQALMPSMKARGGYIVNTSSLVGLLGIFGYTDYAASKFALIGFSEALRSELKPYGITVSVLCPPDTDTPGFATENLTKPEETRAISGTTKLLQPDAVADALIRGMARQSFLIIPGVPGRFSVLAKRLFPGLVERIIDRTVRRAGRGAIRGVR